MKKKLWKRISDRKNETGKKNWLNPTVLGATITSFFSDTSHEIVTTFLPSFLMILGAPAYALGLIEGLSDGLSSLAKVGGGWYADKTGKHKEIATLGYFMTAVFPAILAVASSWPIVLFGRAFGWLGRGIRGPPRDVIMTKSVEQKDLGKAFGLHRAGDTLGAVFGPLVAMLLIEYIGLREIFLLALIPGILATIIFWVLVRQNRSKREQKDKTAESKSNTKSFIVTIKEQPERFKSFLKAVFVFGVADFSHTLLIFFAVATLTPSLGVVNATAVGAGLYLIRNLSYAILCYPFGWLGDRFGKKRVLVFGYLVAVFTFVGFMLSPADPVAYAMLFASAGAFIAAEDTLEGAIAAELSDKNTRGLGFGLLATVNGMGDFVSSVVVSLIFTIFGFLAGFAFCAFVGLMGTYMLLRVE